jgi:hypothetical protein
VTFNPSITSQKLEVTSVSPESVKCRYAGATVGATTIFESSRTQQEFTLDCDRPTNEAVVFTLGAKGMSTNKLQIPMWNDPIPDLKSQMNELAIVSAVLRKRLDSLRVTFGDETPQFKFGHQPGHTPFWNGTPTNAVYGDCPANHVLTGVQFDMTGMKDVRTPTRVQYNCRLVGLATAIQP